MPSGAIVTIDLSRIRANGEAIARATGKPLIAVLKADAYGLGARQVAPVLADLVDAFYLFDLAEATEYGLFSLTGKRTIVLRCDSDDPADYVDNRIHPVVWTSERAAALATTRPVLSVDTGQQRFAADATAARRILESGNVAEVMTHASTPAQADLFASLTADFANRCVRHAAGSSLLDEPAAWFDAVRPGLALFENAVTVEAPLIEARDTAGPAGYSGFVAARHGVIACGYSHGVREGVCLLNGVRRRILEVGMQTSFVEIGANDRVDDAVRLLGADLPLNMVASAWGVSAHRALLALTNAGSKKYVGGG